MKPSPSPAVDFDAIKKTTDIVRVIESYGITLKKGAKEFAGRCPFHDDRTASMNVNQVKGVFHCKGCGATGNATQFVARKEGLGVKEAGLKLCTQIPGVRRAADVAPPPSPPSISDAERAKLLQRVTAFYAKTLHKDRAGLDYLKSRNLADPTMLETFQVGYCNGTLHTALPRSGEVIEQLKAIGILTAKGAEFFCGRVVVPIFDTAGNVTKLYARNVTPCEKNERHRYLAGPHRGVFNGACARTSQTLLITEAIFDAMALWVAGFHNVVALYGTDGWTADHEALIRDNGTTEIFLSLDNNDAGRKATQRLREKLLSLVKTVHVIEWPEQVKDAAEFFESRSAADFEALLRVATPVAQEIEVRSQKSEDEQITMTAEGFAAVYGQRRYELFAVEKPSPAKLKATIKAVASSAGAARFHFDTVDFFLSRSRRNFIVEAARLFRETPESIEADLNRLTLQVESYAAKRLEEKTPRVTLVSEGDKIEGQKLARSPDLVGEILRDMEKLGAVGESVNKLIGYLVMTSRKMDDPLALLILSGSGAGKSHLQDTILSLCPDEDLIKLTSLSDRALFYKGEDSLKHKVLAVEEEAGAAGAHYAIRNLISSKKLVIETTIKNPLTGKMETQVNRVNGPTAVFQTTTNPEADAETRSRFILTSVDESAEQTRAILAAQRNSHTLEGMRRRHGRGAILSRQHAFQRMLKPLAVLNPFEPLLSYGDDRLLDRRDNPKYLSFILAVTFLHQLQRAVKRDAETGADYIESTLADVAVANELATALLGLSLDDLSPPARRLLGQIGQWVQAQAGVRQAAAGKIRFNRRQLRESFKWTEARLRVHLGELVRLEYVLPVGGAMGQAFEYQLVCDPDEIAGGKLFVPGLKSVEQLQKEANLAGMQANLVGVLPHLVGEKRGVVATSPGLTGEVLKGRFPSENGNGDRHLVAFSRGHIPGKVNGQPVEVGAA